MGHAGEEEGCLIGINCQRRPGTFPFEMRRVFILKCGGALFAVKFNARAGKAASAPTPD
jgi:hypothetical protein